MKKLKLEDIQVESYETQAEPPARGTVQGNDDVQKCASPTPGTYCPSWCLTYCNTDCGFSCFTEIDFCCGAPA
jgi:hypothetical protein